MARGQKAKDGDTRVAPNGYHYTKVKGKWELTHRLTIEKAMGRKLRHNERVRFKDGDRTNFMDPKNIQVYVVREGTKARRIAELEAKIEDMQAEVKRLREEDD